MTESETHPTATGATEPVTEATEAAEPTAEPVVETPVGPAPYAVIETGGKQYRVKVGDQISVEHLDASPGSDLNFERVLLVGGDGSTRVGTPIVDGASVTARVEDHYRGTKIIVYKYKAKKRYRRRTGHRQNHTHLTITDITG